MKRKRLPRRRALDFAELVKRHATIRTVDGYWREHGYLRASARAHAKRDGTSTVRLVWRRRDAIVSAVTCTLEGIVLA